MKLYSETYRNETTGRYARIEYGLFPGHISVEMWEINVPGGPWTETKFFQTYDQLVAKAMAETWCDKKDKK